MEHFEEKDKLLEENPLIVRSDIREPLEYNFGGETVTEMPMDHVQIPDDLDDDDDEDESEFIDDGKVYPEDQVPSMRGIIPYVDRELSWLKFNNRVLDLVLDPDVPMLERVKFLSITGSNLDEFFSIRVSSRLQSMWDSDNLTEKRVVDTLVQRCNDMMYSMDKAYDSIITMLSEHDINISDDFTRKKVQKYFKYSIKPSLTPLALDTTRPLPHLKPFSIYIALFVKNVDQNVRMGLVEVPPQLERLTKIGKAGWYFVEDIIIANIEELYPGAVCSDITAFRVIRDGDRLEVDDDKDYVETMAMHARSRILYNEPVRLDIWKGADKKIRNILEASLDISKKRIFTVMSRLKLSDIMDLYQASDEPGFKYPHFKPAEPVGGQKSMMKLVSRGDIVVHHPYESFNDTVLRFIREACEDPNVISIKQTLYRSGSDSKIVKYLIRAAEAGKNVMVVMELKARFDEETNIEWAERLQRAGATVVYGYEHIKTHAKLLHIFRKKGKDAEQFCHIGTGNYSEKNSKIYTDFSYFTSNKKTCSDINNIFNMLTGGLISGDVKFHNIYIAPLEIRDTIYKLVDREIAKGREGYIAIKVNNISDPGIVQKLYDASQAGVSVDIICRGTCSLVPGVQGVSENITVKSIVGRFLEHSRVLVFGRDEDTKAFITSSDLMTRNLDRRLEILFEVEDEYAKEYFTKYIETTSRDTSNAYSMQPDGTYIKLSRQVTDTDLFDSQGELMRKFSMMAKRF